MASKLIGYLWALIMRTMMSILQNQHDQGMLVNLTPTCKLYLTGLIQRTMDRNMTSEDSATLDLSGRFPNDLGRFQSCTSTPNMAYYLIQAGADILRLNVGVCFSQQCTDQDWAQVRDFLTTKLQQKISQPHSFIAKIKGYLIVNINRVETVAKSFVADPLTNLFFAALVVMALLVALASLLKALHKRRRLAGSAVAEQYETDCRRPADSPITRKPQSFTDIFCVQETWRDIAEYRTTSPHQLSVDVLRIFCYLGVLATSFAFTHALFSKIFFDEYTLTYFLHSVYHSVVQGSLYIPDLFLLIGGYNGLQAALRVLDSSKASRSLLWYPVVHLLLVAKRFVKFSLPLTLAMIYLWKVLPQIADGPLSVTDLACTKKNFLTSLVLYNSNFAGNEQRMCAPWYWYLAVDFQLFLVVPFVAQVFRCSKKAGILCSASLALAGLLASLVYNHVYSIKVLNIEDGSWITSYMTKSYCRAFCYYLGCTVCLVQRARSQDSPLPRDTVYSTPTFRVLASGSTGETLDSDCKPRISKRLSEATLVAGTVMFCSAYYTFYFYFQSYMDTLKLAQWKHTLYNSFVPACFAVSVWMIFAGTIYRHYSLVRRLLATKTAFLFMRALYFEILLVSMPLVLTSYFAIQSMPSFTAVLFYTTIIGELVAVMLIAFAVRCIVTAPTKRLCDSLLATAVAAK